MANINTENKTWVDTVYWFKDRYCCKILNFQKRFKKSCRNGVDTCKNQKSSQSIGSFFW